jgi:hypothetical protein
MENKKYEKLIDLIINEQDEKARELFHEIVVEKSREIYESIMDEEVMEAEKDDEEAVEESAHSEEAVEESLDGMEEGHPAGQVMDMMDEISAEEAGGMVEGEDEDDIDFDDDAEEAGDDLTHDLEADHDEEGSVDKSDLGDIKDKLDDLMAEFEAIMSGGEGEEEEVEVSDEEEAALAEAVQLQKVSVTHGDDGANKKSVVAANAGAKGMDSKPVKFSGDNEAVPTGPKGPKDYLSKGEGDLPGAGKFKNVPGGKAKVDLASAPKPVTSQASGVNVKSPVAKG